MKHSEKVLAFIGKWLNDVQTKPGGYAIAYDYKHNPQKLTFYRAYKSYNETMAESIFAPSWEAYLDDDVLEKEVTDALNKLKEKVDRWHACEEDGYERRRMMTYGYFSDVVLDWTLMHPEAKEEFRLTYDYWATCQAFHIRMEYVPHHHGKCELLDEDIMDKLACPHDYIFAVLDDMYKTLKEDEEQERIKLRDYVQAWIYMFADHHDDDIKVRVEFRGNGYRVDLIKDYDGKSVSASGRITRNHEEAWRTFAADLYKKFKEKEKKEMEIEFARREDNDVRLKMAKAAVVKWYNEHNAPAKITMDDVYIVWFCKVLQNWKALAGAHHSDGMYYEITFDGNNDLVYFDAYKKWQNVKMDGTNLREGIC